MAFGTKGPPVRYKIHLVKHPEKPALVQNSAGFVQTASPSGMTLRQSRRIFGKDPLTGTAEQGQGKDKDKAELHAEQAGATSGRRPACRKHAMVVNRQAGAALQPRPCSLVDASKRQQVVAHSKNKIACRAGKVDRVHCFLLWEANVWTIRQAMSVTDATASPKIDRGCSRVLVIQPWHNVATASGPFATYPADLADERNKIAQGRKIGQRL
jgi:hypothetical protein